MQLPHRMHAPVTALEWSWMRIAIVGHTEEHPAQNVQSDWSMDTAGIAFESLFSRMVFKPEKGFKIIPQNLGDLRRIHFFYFRNFCPYQADQPRFIGFSPMRNGRQIRAVGFDEHLGKRRIIYAKRAP
jgi:hypothetical protein